MQKFKVIRRLKLNSLAKIRIKNFRIKIREYQYEETTLINITKYIDNWCSSI